jgi:hypothetical protein
MKNLGCCLFVSVPFLIALYLLLFLIHFFLSSCVCAFLCVEFFLFSPYLSAFLPGLISLYIYTLLTAFVFSLLPLYSLSEILTTAPRCFLLPRRFYHIKQTP